MVCYRNINTISHWHLFCCHLLLLKTTLCRYLNTWITLVHQKLTSDIGELFWYICSNYILIRVHIVAQFANQYIVVFHIAILYDIYLLVPGPRDDKLSSNFWVRKFEFEFDWHIFGIWILNYWATTVQNGAMMLIFSDKLIISKSKNINILQDLV